jgi:predicted extracellular nuclease
VPEFVPANPRPTAAPEVGGDLKVASFNVLNLFNTFDGCTAGVGGEIVDCRGADDALELERQVAKIVSAVGTLDSDVIGLIELENDGYGPGSAIAELVDRLNAAVGAGTWAFIDADAGTGQVNALGVDAIKVGMIYKPSRVSPVGSTATLNTARFVTGGDGEIRNRPALAQAFETPAGARFIAVVNHFKSKGSPCDVADAGDGQGNCNLVRTVAAEELARWLASDPTGTGDPDILITGDLNAYAQEDPIRALRQAGFRDLLDRDQGPGAYTFVFSGQWGYLDYALASPSMSAQVTGAAAALLNSDEPLTLDYNLEFKSPTQQELLYAPDAYRSSDHDPVVVGLELLEPWDFGGFRAPFEAFPDVNLVRAGRPLLLRFSLGGDRGRDIFADGFPASYPVDCQTQEPTGDATLAETVRDRDASYTRSGRYRYFWQTDRAWAGQCRILEMRFREGTTALLLVRFR